MTAEELKGWRTKLGVSQEDLALRLQVARNTVSRWESGQRAIPSFLRLALKQIEAEIKRTTSNDGQMA